MSPKEREAIERIQNDVTKLVINLQTDHVVNKCLTNSIAVNHMLSRLESFSEQLEIMLMQNSTALPQL